MSCTTTHIQTGLPVAVHAPALYVLHVRTRMRRLRDAPESGAAPGNRRDAHARGIIIITPSIDSSVVSSFAAIQLQVYYCAIAR